MRCFILFYHEKEFCNEHLCTESLQEFLGTCQDEELLGQMVS